MEIENDHICYTCWIAQLGNPFDCRTREHREPQRGMSPEMEGSEPARQPDLFGAEVGEDSTMGRNTAKD